LSAASLEKPMNEIRKIEIVFKGALFLDTFSTHQKKHQGLKQKFEKFLKRVLIKNSEIIKMTDQNTNPQSFLSKDRALKL